jgi:hypothetical protein
VNTLIQRLSEAADNTSIHLILTKKNGRVWIWLIWLGAAASEQSYELS